MPEIESRDAAVVRCASCGAAREEGARSCAYCGSDFTLHEQDLETICPNCFARISNSAKFCHHCGTAIAPEDVAADPTDRVCPACGGERFLHSRPLGSTGLTCLECNVCGGLWLGPDVYQAVEERARKEAKPLADPAALRAEAAARPKLVQKPGPFYRPCPVCRTPMIRINFERVSGILIDQCRDHGIWFDATELDAVLRWIKLGGEQLAQSVQADEERARLQQLRFKVEPKSPDDARSQIDLGAGPPDSGLDAIPWLVNWILKR